MIRVDAQVRRRDVLATARGVTPPIEQLHAEPREHARHSLGHAIAGDHGRVHAGGGRGDVHRLRFSHRGVRPVLRVEVHGERVLASLRGGVLAVEVVRRGARSGRIGSPGQRERIGSHRVDIHGNAQCVAGEDVVVYFVTEGVLGGDRHLDLVPDVAVAYARVTEPLHGRGRGRSRVHDDVHEARVDEPGCGHDGTDAPRDAGAKVGVLRLRADQRLEQPRASLGLRQGHDVRAVAVVEDRSVARGSRPENFVVKFDLNEPSSGGPHDARVRAAPFVIRGCRKPRTRVGHQLDQVPRLLPGVRASQRRPHRARQQRVNVHVQRVGEDVNRLGRTRDVDAVKLDTHGDVSR